MKSYIWFFILFSFALTAQAQLDNKSGSFSIPAVESKTENKSIAPAKPAKPVESNSAFNFNTPSASPNLDAPNKEFSMFSTENFGNPGELYTKRLDEHLEDVKLSKKEMELRNGSSTDQHFGNFKSNAKFVNVVYRDHGAVDGDLIQVLVNDDIIYARVFLSGGFKGFNLDLKPGINKIDFLALNQGQSGPNTAEFRVVDDNENLVSQNLWNLATGAKATIIVVKE